MNNFEKFIREARSFIHEKSLERYTACPDDYMHNDSIAVSILVEKSTPIRRAYLATVRKVILAGDDFRGITDDNKKLATFNARYNTLTERLKVVMFHLSKLSIEDYLDDIHEKQYKNNTYPVEIEYHFAIFNQYPSLYYESALREFKKLMTDEFKC